MKPLLGFGLGSLFAVVCGLAIWPDDGAQLRQMATAAQAWLDTLDDAQRKRAQLPLGDASRREWHFVPREYPGIALGEMNDRQKLAAHALLSSALSSAGYLKATTIVSLENVLRELERAAGNDAAHRDPGRYWLQVFGSPSASAAFGWRLQGHHLSLHFSAAEGQLVASTPFFFGSNPHQVRSGPFAGLRVLGHEEDLARNLLASLREEQRQRAVLDIPVPADVILGPDRAADFLGAPKGIALRDLDEAQQRLLWRLIDVYVDNLQPEFASAQKQRIRAAGEHAIHFAWVGTMVPGDPHYYRVHGPTFVLEYDNVQNKANHSHTVWRDLERDFGGDVLRRHHEQDHK